jgi:hypothetical protein
MVAPGFTTGRTAKAVGGKPATPAVRQFSEQHTMMPGKITRGRACGMAGSRTARGGGCAQGPFGTRAAEAAKTFEAGTAAQFAPGRIRRGEMPEDGPAAAAPVHDGATEFRGGYGRTGEGAELGGAVARGRHTVPAHNVNNACRWWQRHTCRWWQDAVTACVESQSWGRGPSTHAVRRSGVVAPGGETEESRPTPHGNPQRKG